MTALSDIRTELDQTSSILEQCRRNVAKGQLIDLTGLDQRIEGMCKSILELPEGDRQSVKARLIGLIDDLNALVEMLNRQQETVSDGLKGVTSREKAVSAYGQGLKTGKADKKDPTP